MACIVLVSCSTGEYIIFVYFYFILENNARLKSNIMESIDSAFKRPVTAKLFSKIIRNIFYEIFSKLHIEIKLLFFKLFNVLII